MRVGEDHRQRAYISDELHQRNVLGLSACELDGVSMAELLNHLVPTAHVNLSNIMPPTIHFVYYVPRLQSNSFQSDVEFPC